MRLVKVYIYTSWIPLALFLFSLLYLESLQGWGQWSAVGVVLPSLALSIFYTAIGLLTLAFYQEKLKRLILGLMLSSSVIVFVVIRYIVLSF